MAKKICLATIFLALFSQMLFLGEHNVVYANWLSLPVIIGFFLSVHKNKKLYFNFHCKVLSSILIFFLLSYFWADNQSHLELRSYRTFFLTLIFIICISNIMLIYSSVKPVMWAFWGITLVNFIVLLDIIPQNLFFDTESTELRFYGTFNNPNVGAIAFILSMLLADYSLKKKKSTSVFTPFFLILIILICFLLTIATASKKGIVLIILYFFYKIFSSKSLTRYFKNIMLIGLFGLIGLMSFDINIALDYLNSSANRLNAFFDQIDNVNQSGGSTSERLYFIYEGIKGFYTSPIYGHGFESFQFKYGKYAHNNYFELLYCGGLIVLLMYLYLYYKLFSLVKTHHRNIKTLVCFSILSIMVLDLAAVSYSLKIIQYFICTLFALVFITNPHSIRNE